MGSSLYASYPLCSSVSPYDTPYDDYDSLSVTTCSERRRVLDTVLLCSTISAKDCQRSVLEAEQKLGVLDCVEYRMVFL